MFSVGDTIAIIAVITVGGKIWWDLKRLEDTKVDKSYCDYQSEWLCEIDRKIEILSNDIQSIKESQARINTSLDFILKNFSIGGKNDT